MCLYEFFFETGVASKSTRDQNKETLNLSSLTHILQIVLYNAIQFDAIEITDIIWIKAKQPLLFLRIIDF